MTPDFRTGSHAFVDGSTSPCAQTRHSASSVVKLPLARWCAFVASGVTVATATCAQAQSISERWNEVARMRQEAASRDVNGATLLGALLYTDITVDFKATKAKDAIDFIANALGVPVVARYSTDKVGNGIDPETEITLSAQSKPALSVLEMVLEQCSVDEPCTWQLRGTFIEVGTKERLSVPAAREVRMYPIRDLIFEPPLFDNAPEFNLNDAIQQGNNGGGGGGGSGGGGGGGFGGGGGGGGFGGGGGGSGGSGGGGRIFGEPGDAPEAVPEDERAQRLVDIIVETIEPDAWAEAGGDVATIRYYQGVLIVRAPDFIQRQIGGYPFAPASRSRSARESRYVTFSAPISVIENVQFRPVTVTGAAGGSGFGGGNGNPAPPSSGNNSGSKKGTNPRGGSSGGAGSGGKGSGSGK